MTDNIMKPRLAPLATDMGARFVTRLVATNMAITDSTLPSTIRDLVTIRASQINGCSFCLDMHTKDAAVAGETSDRLNVVAAWREATVFTDAERAALELTEQGTRIADAAGGVTEVAWAAATEHYDDEQLMAIVAQISLINAFNRASVILRRPTGDYQPGRLRESDGMN